MGHGEHDMQIVHRDQFARARRYPAVACQDLALRAMAVAAGVERESEILTALGAAIAVTAERSGAAALDGAHDLMLPRRCGHGCARGTCGQRRERYQPPP